MRILQALRHPSVRRLWAGEVFSAIGDEVYGVAVIWFATSLIGGKAGYLAAVQAGSVLAFSLFGGLWADHRDPRRTMISVDLLCGFTVLLLPLLAYFHALNLFTLLPVIVVVAGNSALFSPALLEVLTREVPPGSLRDASNGLMQTTVRLARIVGPGLVGLFGALVPFVHYFTIDAITFFGSAFAVMKIPPGDGAFRGKRASVKDAILAGHRLTFQQPLVAFTLWSGAISNGAWAFVLPLGITLLVRERFPQDLRALGFLISAYGVGNVVSNVVISNYTMRSPVRWIGFGRLCACAGFTVLALNRNWWCMVPAAAFAATGGPITDLAFVTLLQRHFQGRDMARIYRYQMAAGNATLLLSFAISPSLLRIFPISSVILGAAGLIGAMGLAALKVPDTSGRCGPPRSSMNRPS